MISPQSNKEGKDIGISIFSLKTKQKKLNQNFRNFDITDAQMFDNELTSKTSNNL